jgi:phage shock protein A
MTADSLLTWTNLLLGMLTITVMVVGVVKSGYYGPIEKYIIEPRKKAQRANEQIDSVEGKISEISDELDTIADRQETQTDALIAMGESVSNGKEFDVDSFREETDNQRADQFLKNGSDNSTHSDD